MCTATTARVRGGSGARSSSGSMFGSLGRNDSISTGVAPQYADGVRGGEERERRDDHLVADRAPAPRRRGAAPRSRCETATACARAGHSATAPRTPSCAAPSSASPSAGTRDRREVLLGQLHVGQRDGPLISAAASASAPTTRSCVGLVISANSGSVISAARDELGRRQRVPVALAVGDELVHRRIEDRRLDAGPSRVGQAQLGADAPRPRASPASRNTSTRRRFLAGRAPSRRRRGQQPR